MEKNLLIRSYEHFDIYRVSYSSIYEYTRFVIDVNYRHHLNAMPPESEIEKCVSDDLSIFEKTHFYALYSKNGEIFGTINVSKCDNDMICQLESDYRFKLSAVLDDLNVNPHEIWHIGRYAISREFINSNIDLIKHQALYFKILLVCAFSHICSNRSNLMLAECDTKLNKIVKLLNIHSKQIAESEVILASETAPIINTGEGLLPFYNKYKYLIQG